MLSCFRYFSEKHLLLSNSRQRILHEGMNGVVDAKELFQLSLSRSAPCGTGQTTIDTGCDPTLARNLVDHTADCNPLTKCKSIKFLFIWPSTLNHDGKSLKCRGVPDGTTAFTAFFRRPSALICIKLPNASANKITLANVRKLKTEIAAEGCFFSVMDRIVLEMTEKN